MRSEPPSIREELTRGEVIFPQAVISELFVLSSFVREPGLFSRHPLDPYVFARPDLRELYQAMVATGDTNLMVLSQHLFDRGRLAAMLPSTLKQVAGYAIHQPEHFPHHLEILLDRHGRRKAIEASRRAIGKAIDCADPAGLAGAVALLESIDCALPVTGRGFGLVHVSEIDTGDPPRDFVEGLFAEGGASVVYGESNVGKSFWVLDIAAHVTTGQRWRNGGREVDRGAVVYVALEGTHGLRLRIQAMKQSGILTDDAPLYICFSPVSLLEPTHAARLAESVKSDMEKSGLPCRLVIIDTLARAMAGGDENTSKDMTAVVASIDAVRAATGAHVCIVHHCGKDIARGARGHSSLRAAVDTEIEIFRPDGERISTVRVTKQRDLERGEPMPFSLTVVEIGQDRRGKPITSCVVKHEDVIMACKGRPAKRRTTYTAEALLEYLPATDVPDWARRAKEDCGIGSSRFYEMKAELKDRGAYRVEVESGNLVRT